ncbi:VOC family protein [Actinomyces bowdenii]|uniref:VOC family protein n=1 Tax=Actinomyces bowdenii TaxID=131109 RepID=UPI00214BA931|nr:VOC family protein [Actinomyces bowdenii]MCR2053574.1 VOC family protein [Actinomyces bowdenii]
MQLVTPYFCMPGTADQALTFYIEAFGTIGSQVSVLHRSSHPVQVPPQAPAQVAAMAGKTLAAVLSFDGIEVGLINAGPELRPTPSISLMVNLDPAVIQDAPRAARRLWAALSDGGEVRMPLDSYPFSPCYGWVEDRYGINWQVILTDPQGEPRPFILPSLLFGPGSRGAREAVDYYLGVFPGSELGRRESYPDDEALVLFSDAQLGGQWMTAMDSSAPMPFDFTAGSSLMIRAETQGEINYYWERLSAVPEAERCGWCQDHFGVSWQVLPSPAELSMLSPRQYAALMGMTRIDLAALRAQ